MSHHELPIETAAALAIATADGEPPPGLRARILDAARKSPPGDEPAA